jgi:histone-binding protein RBBP4
MEKIISDTTKKVSKPGIGAKCEPDYILKGHISQGYGLAWNTLTKTQLSSTSDDGSLCVFDVGGTTQISISSSGQKTESVIPALFHVCPVERKPMEDCCWSFYDSNILGSCSDCGSAYMFVILFYVIVVLIIVGIFDKLIINSQKQ